ncbi:hypothetical protein [Nocardiopsis alborubida]|uniref:Uncharacterized protein n=1 Tax=Nocardiopsis alborubida TaxID=146802 RepID=A0A7X6RP34_9ACTN|nr:hypothetical protein [Nocardiopsis alborubida]NKY96772.1 hypothetical protein [Nocardiopsis alborubida]
MMLDPDRGPYLFELDPVDHGPARWVIAATDDPQCTARTTKGRRCANTVLRSHSTSLYAHPVRYWSHAGLLRVYRVEASDEIQRVWLEQRCRLHDTVEAVDECAVEWRPYEPEHDSARFTEDLPALPRLPEPGQNWSEVPEWIAELWRIGRYQREHLGVPAGASYVPGRGWTA